MGHENVKFYINMGMDFKPKMAHPYPKNDQVTPRATRIQFIKNKEANCYMCVFLWLAIAQRPYVHE